MRKTLTWLGVLALGAVLQGGLFERAVAQGSAPGSSAANPAPDYGGSISDQAAVTEGGGTESEEPATQLPVLYVTGVEITRTKSEPQLDIIRVTGLTGSQGWNAPGSPTFVGKPLDGILDLQFIATMPLQTEPATGFVPIGAVFTLKRSSLQGGTGPCLENAIEVDHIGQQDREDHGQRLQGLRRQEIC